MSIPTVKHNVLRIAYLFLLMRKCQFCMATVSLVKNAVFVVVEHVVI